MAAAAPQAALLLPDSRPARMKLVANRFTSHSKGPRIVSSKSLMSKTSRPSGATYAPSLRTWASPHSWVKMPVWGSTARSAAMTGTAPRKKPKGEAAIRCHLIAISAGTRPTAEAARASMGSVCRSAERHRFCSCRRTCLRRDCPKARRSGGGSTCLMLIQQMLHLHIDRVRPTETNHILIPGDQLHVRRSGLDIVFLMDRPLLLEAGADGVSKLFRYPAGIIVVAIFPETVDGEPVQRRPAKGQIPLQAARVRAAGQPAGPVKQSKVARDQRRLFLCRQAGPERIEDGRVYEGGLFPGGEVVIEEHPFTGVPKVLVDGRAAGFRLLAPRCRRLTFMEQGGEVGQVAFVLEEQAIQPDGCVMMGGTTERAETETNVKARLAHRPVALVEVATQAIAMSPGKPADHGMGRIAAGSGEHCLLRRRRVFRCSDQVAGVDVGMIYQPVDHVDVVVAVVGDIGHRTLPDIEISRQAGLSGTVDATQPEIVIPARVRVSARQPFPLFAEIGG